MREPTGAGTQPVLDAMAGLVPAFDLLGIAAYRLEADGTVSAANEACCRWLGRPAHEVVGRSVHDLAPPAARDAVVGIISRLVDDPSVHLVHGDRLLRPVDGPPRRTRFLAAAARCVDRTFDHAIVAVMDLDAPGVVEAAPPFSQPHAAALRIAEAHRLGPRLEEMLVLLATGHRISTIATTVHLAEGTVRNRVSELGDALGVSGQSAIVALVQAEVQAYAAAQASENVSPR